MPKLNQAKKNKEQGALALFLGVLVPKHIEDFKI